MASKEILDRVDIVFKKWKNLSDTGKSMALLDTLLELEIDLECFDIVISRFEKETERQRQHERLEGGHDESEQGVKV